MRPRRIVTLIAATGWLAAAWPQAELAVGYLCQRASEVYWVKVDQEQPDQPVPCRVVRWLGPSNQKELWRATTDPAFCEARAREVRDKLIAYGWLCQPVDALFKGVPEALDRPSTAPAAPAPETAVGGNVVM